MFNTSKITSLINSGELNPSIVSRATGINYQSLKSKLKSGSYTPDDVEKIANYFNKPITYFFDKEAETYQLPEVKPDVANDGNDSCKLCKEKDKLIEKMEGWLKDKEIIIELLNKKETPDADSTQLGEGAKQNKVG